MAKKERSAVTQTAAPPNPSLERLGILVGDWDIKFSALSFQSDPSAVGYGRASFQWLEEGAFVIEHSEAFESPVPRGTALIGPDDTAGTYCMLYFDSRGVSRIYQMSLGDGVWRIWRNFPGFSQRFTGIFAEDGNTIKASWEKSTDGSQWEHDFDLTYTRAK